MQVVSLNEPDAVQSNLPAFQPSHLPASGQAVSLPRLVIAAPQGRSGKTTIALGLCAALVRQGLAVQPFKKGPDYIDPSWLSEAAGRACRSLDPFFLVSSQNLQRAFVRGAVGTGISLIEGNHGLYDSLDDEGTGSTAALARCLQAPIILVVNAARMSRSVAALVRGYQTFEPDTPLVAVILNNVAQGSSHGARSRHEHKLRQAIEHFCHIPVVGALPRSDVLTIPDRHLGLVPRTEDDTFIPAIAACRRAAGLYIDLDAVVALARTAPGMQLVEESPGHADGQLIAKARTAEPTVRVGVVRDRAFTFYYPENLEALVAAGAQLVFIDALRDANLPEVDALYIGGGFPEMFMEELSANGSLRRDIRKAARAGLPIYAECGGLMYLARHILWRERRAEMVGALPCDVEMTAQPQGHGYIIAQAVNANPFLPIGSTLRGHEFHHSRIVNLESDLPTAYRLARGNGLGGGQDGLVYRNILAAYTHLHADGSPGWAAGLVAAARAHHAG